MKSRCFPVAVRHASPEAFTARAATMATHHVGRGPGLVDKGEAFGSEIGLVLEPVLATPQDAGAMLLAGMRRLFLSVIW